MLALNDGRSELWQWDTRRTLSVDADCSQVHFSNKVFGRSIDVDVVDGTAIIPDILLQTDNDLNVWAFVGTAENGYTKISKTFKVNRRNKPADYVFTQTDQMTLQMIQRQIGDLSDLTTEAKDTLVAAVNEALSNGGGEVDPEAVQKIVEDYLAANPPTITESDPTVPAWAKQPTKPTYTAAEVGALPDTYTPPNQTAQQVGADPAGTAASAVSQHNTDTTAHNDLRLALQELANRINAALDSDDTTLDQMSEVVAYIKSNKTLIDAITTSKVSVADIVNDLVTNAAGKPLSAAQGVVIKTLIDALRNEKLDAAELTNAINTALAQAKASGEFDGADGKSAYQYAQEGGYTGTDAEFAAKLAQEMPEALPNPNALTFSGAVTGSYDGSAPLSVEIPSGGGGGSSVSANIEKVYSWTADGTVQSNLDSLAIEANKLYFCELLVPSDASMSAGSVTTPEVYVRIGTSGNTYTGCTVGLVKGQHKYIALLSKYTFFVDSGNIHIILDRIASSQNVPTISNYTEDKVYIYSNTSGTAILNGTTVKIYKMG